MVMTEREITMATEEEKEEATKIMIGSGGRVNLGEAITMIRASARLKKRLNIRGYKDEENSLEINREVIRRIIEEP